MEAPAVLSLGVTLGLVLTRPRIHAELRVGPALAATVGVLMMLVTGLVDHSDLIATGLLMWRPLVAVSSIMVMTAVAQRVGLMTWLATVMEARGERDARHLFNVVYALSAATAAALNNDSAILLLTPLVIALIRRRYPSRPALVVPFAFCVFMAAGVAPLVVSNPMNMIVAAYAGIDFNQYAFHMVPVALAGWGLGLVVLRALFRRALDEAGDQAPVSSGSTTRAPSSAQRQALALVLGVLVAYPIVALAGGPVWAVALAGATLALALGRRHGVAPPKAVLAEGISWDILAFLVAVSILGVGLRNAGIVARLTGVYAAGGTIGIGVVSAIGSAVVNNHPMSIINMLALENVPGAGMRQTLAALIGGDLGPRLLPMGSLAGLLWLEALRRQKVDVSPVRFAAVGLALTIPTLAISLLVLYALT